MRGKFVNGRIEVDGNPLPDGTEVDVYLHDEEEPSIEILDPELIAILDESIDEMERGEGEPWETVRQRIFGR